MAVKRKPKRARRVAHQPAFIVGIGGSAGSLDAFEKFFASVPPDTGMTFVIVTHLDPDHRGLLPELLQRTTAMPVRQVEDGMHFAANAVYVIPPSSVLEVAGDALRLRPASRSGPNFAIDALFRSLARDHGTTAVGVVLSGMGSDGAKGLAAIIAAGGAALVQDPATAAFDAMPRAALAAVRGAEVGDPDDLAARIAGMLLGRPAASGPALARILEALRRRTGRDLSLYKPSSIERRIERRLSVLRLATVDDYAAYIEANPEEAEVMFRELMIGVTQFFRDPETFEVLRALALPGVIAARQAPGTIRAWVAGCSTGEEAYSLAIVIREALAAAHASEISAKIYATDIDANAIAVARAGHYPAGIAEHVPAEWLARYFTPEEHGYRIRQEIRDCIVFAQHDMTADPPFTRLDVASCRNVLIYMQPVLQQKLLVQFHYALGHGGVLVLGGAETVSSTVGLFTAIDAKAKVYRRLDMAGASALPVDLGITVRSAPAPVRSTHRSAELTVVEAARRAIVDSVAPPTALINDRGDILYTSRRTGRYLEPAVGKANVNIFAMAREGLGPQLGLAVRQAAAKRRRVNVAGVVVRGERGRIAVDLSVLPILEPESLRGLLLVAFEDAADAAKPVAKGDAAQRRLPIALGRELARTKEQLHAVVREMEASQGRVEATNEELQSANEELQSANEELTTSKEELQSLNEELMTLNAELEATNTALTTANDDLRNLLNSTKIPTLFLDNALRLKRFTSEATRVANVIANDVGRVITDITLKVAYEGLARDVEEVLATLVFKEVQLDGADQTSYTMRIHPYRTMTNMIDGVVITFSEVTALRRAERALAANAHDKVLARVLDRWPGLVCVRDLVLGEDIYLNERARTRLRSEPAGARFESLLHPGDAADSAAWFARLQGLRDAELAVRPIRLRAPDGSYGRFQARESVLARSATGTPTQTLAVLEPVADAM